MERSLTTYQSIGTEDIRSIMLGLLAQAYGKSGRIQEGLDRLSEALVFVRNTGERFYEAEIHRLQGELLLVRGNADQAEASFRRAMALARKQSAKSWELWAVVSLSHLWQRQGKMDEAQQMLAEICRWFPERLDTRDLREAKALLEELS